MVLNDEQEKLRVAREWLLTTRPPKSIDWDAAWDHVTWVLAHTQDAALWVEAAGIVEAVRAKQPPEDRSDG